VLCLLCPREAMLATPPGAVFLQEPLTLRLTLSLVLVSIGIYVVNRK